MSTRISLRVRQRPDPDDPAVIITRLIAHVAFLSEDGDLTESREAFVDTGAPISLIPCDIWEGCRVLKLGESSVQGIVPRPECALDVMDGAIACVVHDEVDSSELLVIRAHLAPIREVPLLLGFSGLLDRADLYFSADEGEAYLEV